MACVRGRALSTRLEDLCVEFLVEFVVGERQGERCKFAGLEVGSSYNQEDLRKSQMRYPPETKN